MKKIVWELEWHTTLKMKGKWDFATMRKAQGFAKRLHLAWLPMQQLVWKRSRRGYVAGIRGYYRFFLAPTPGTGKGAQMRKNAP